MGFRGWGWAGSGPWKPWTHRRGRSWGWHRPTATRQDGGEVGPRPRLPAPPPLTLRACACRCRAGRRAAPAPAGRRCRSRWSPRRGTATAGGRDRAGVTPGTHRTSLPCLGSSSPRCRPRPRPRPAQSTAGSLPLAQDPRRGAPRLTQDRDPGTSRPGWVPGLRQPAPSRELASVQPRSAPRPSRPLPGGEPGRLPPA